VGNWTPPGRDLMTAAQSALGYGITALLYLGAWLNPRLGPGEKLIGWVSFEKLCLTEFLSCHAITLLAGTALAMQMEGGSKEFSRIYWGLIIFYFVMGTATFLFHRDHRALLGFYVILATRGLGILSLQSADQDMLRAEVLKNLVMFFPMMLLISAISFGDGGIRSSSQEAFIQGRLGFFEKISQGRNLLFVAAYYILWAFLTWKWPPSIAK
jgi:hypothetical protein